MSTQPAQAELKIAYIGGGSRAWAHNLMNDLAVCPDLCGEVLLYDIDLQAARLNERLGNWLQGQPGVQSRWHYRAVEKLEEALRGADFVFISIQPGPLEMMGHEIGVAEAYGLFFPVGDTTGAPGLMRGLRSAIIYAGFAHAIAEHCPRAWVINYSNPMTICTRTLTRVEPRLKVFGCCHEVFSTQEILAEVAQERLGLPERPARDDIRVNVLGINHFTWIDRATYQGHDLLALLREHVQEPGVRRPFTRAEVEAQHNYFFDARQVKFELFRRFGLLAAAGDRHLVEFVQGFTRSPEDLFRWGVIRTPISYRIERWQQSAGIAEDVMAGRRPWKLAPSGEEAVRQIKALCGLGDFITNVNFENHGQISNLPARVVLETNAHLSRDMVRPLTAGALPAGVRALVARHVANQEMLIDAALRRDKDQAFQAVFGDPTTNLPVDQAWAMFEEIGLPEGWW
jgi:alpha-galactosidase/6-phospho-beta-glucosidase family protein